MLPVRAGIQLDEHNQAAAALEAAAYSTLIGTSIAVVSSTLMYLNAWAFCIWFDHVRRRQWLNPFVLGVNVNCTMSAIGMLLASNSSSHQSICTGNGLREASSENPFPQRSAPFYLSLLYEIG